MCGFVGYLGPPLADAKRSLGRAAAAIRHRGPDDGGFWQDDVGGVALAHRRLSIIDVSVAGHQPMLSRCGRWVTVFNGEIYNHLALRRQLESEHDAAPGTAGGHVGWRGGSDTETLLAYVARWGVAKTVDALEGMFALALWDRRDRRLHLARDRMGEKPLYYGRVGAGWAFASELKALKALPGFDAPVDRTAVAAFVRHGAVPGARSIYVGIAKLAPGMHLETSLEDLEAGRPPQPQAYWRLLDAARRGRAAPLVFDGDAGAVDALDAVLSAAVKAQMLSDVPVGAFLSGGIDSSTVVSLMQAHGTRRARTFSIGFDEAGFDEAVHARAVARHLGTDHSELYVDEAAARDVIPLLPSIYCEPFADPSQIPTYLVSKLAREQVTVCLSGDGGDEMFAGYGNYLLAAKLWTALRIMPLAVRLALADGVRAVSPGGWNAALKAAGRLVPRGPRERLSGDRLHKGAVLLGARSFTEFYRDGFAAHWHPEVVLGAGDPRGPGDDADELDDFSVIERMTLRDASTYLPDDILVKVDRAAMSVGLETRVPLLDRRVVEFALRLPPGYKVRDGQGKWLLRQVLYRYVPSGLVDRPKMGFGVPVGRWLRGPLKDWAEGLLEPGRLRREGYFDPALVTLRWREHLSGDRNWQFPLWRVLMFQAWLESGGRVPAGA